MILYKTGHNARQPPAKIFLQQETFRRQMNRYLRRETVSGGRENLLCCEERFSKPEKMRFTLQDDSRKRKDNQEKTGGARKPQAQYTPVHRKERSGGGYILRKVEINGAGMCVFPTGKPINEVRGSDSTQIGRHFSSLFPGETVRFSSITHVDPSLSSEWAASSSAWP
jgi:hypothetical protein